MQPEKNVDLNEADFIVRRFINMYVIRRMWVKRNRSINDFIETFYPGDRGRKRNKYAYDKALIKPADFNADKYAKHQSGITGLDLAYFMDTDDSGHKSQGPKKFFKINGLIEADWIKYVNLMNKTPEERLETLTETKDYENLKIRIENAVDDVIRVPSAMSQDMDTIWYYVCNLEKKKGNLLLDRITAITSSMDELSTEDLKKLLVTKELDGYLEKIRSHYKIADAVKTLYTPKKKV